MTQGSKVKAKVEDPTATPVTSATLERRKVDPEKVIRQTVREELRALMNASLEFMYAANQLASSADFEAKTDEERAELLAGALHMLDGGRKYLVLAQLSLQCPLRSDGRDEDEPPF